jgi:hypothetical protein
MMLKPPLQVKILIHPSAAGIEDQAGKLQGFPFLQIMLNQNLPFRHNGQRNPGITISR